MLCIACTDFLDVTPKGKIIPVSYDDYKSLQDGAYSLSNLALKLILEVRTDNVTLNEAGSSFQQYKDVFSWNDNTSSSLTAQTRYQDFYEVIAYENQIINNFKFDEFNENHSQLVGEAYAMRALMNFYLISMYSKPYDESQLSIIEAAPIATKIDIEQVFLKSSLEEMINQIDSDLEYATKLIKIYNFSNNQKYRFSRTALSLLKARYSLYKYDYNNAKLYSLEAINSKPLDSIIERYEEGSNLEAYNYTSKENVLAFGDFHDFTNEVYADTNLTNLYSADDYRTNFYFVDVTNRPTVSIKKRSNRSNACCFRYSEAILNLAEVEARIGSVDEAGNYLIKLLNRRLKYSQFKIDSARIDNIIDRDIMLTEVLTERRKEFAFEGFRWFDLKRINRPKIVHVLEGEEYILKENDSRYTLPFPRSAINANPRLLD
jgi:hypothetical protein